MAYNTKTKVAGMLTKLARFRRTHSTATPPAAWTATTAATTPATGTSICTRLPKRGTSRESTNRNAEMNMGSNQRTTKPRTASGRSSGLGGRKTTRATFAGVGIVAFSASSICWKLSPPLPAAAAKTSGPPSAQLGSLLSGPAAAAGAPPPGGPVVAPESPPPGCKATVVAEVAFACWRALEAAKAGWPLGVRSNRVAASSRLTA
mmetsp:Transcript_93844/g.235627  ORF Transcript_93844/g.235627 Transcript_93844/m.235627 type:complete len:205 (-) Transcript_93844:97-711(-)